MDRAGGGLLVATIVAAAAVVVVPARWRARLLAVAAAAASGAFLRLAWAFATSDFRLVEVAEGTRRALDGPLRIAATWGGMNGSFLLWCALLAVIAAVGGRRGGPEAVALGAVVAAFAAIGSVWANPFDLLDAPPNDGLGLTPILEHPAMVIHPPVLYVGLLAFVVPWARAVTADRDVNVGDGDGDGVRRSDSSAGSARRWLLVGWTVTTAGLLLGSRWAYDEVGWGGWWGWDPVENGALLPWFAATAALHRSLAASPSAAGAPRRRPGALLGVPFVFVVLGAMSTRSGWQPSVHAFAEGRAVGIALAALTTALAATSVVAWAAGVRRTSTTWRSPIGQRETGTAAIASTAPVWLALVALALVAAGTQWPFLADLVGARARATEGTWFARTLAPVALLAAGLLATAGAAARTATGPEALFGVRPAHLGAAGGALLAAVVVTVTGTAPVPTGVFAVAGAAVVGAGLTRPWRAGASIAHVGFALLLLGIAGSTATVADRGTLPVGGALDVGGYTVVNRSVTTDGGPAGSSGRVTVELDVFRGTDGATTAAARSDALATLRPQLVGYAERGQLLAETDRRSGLLDDVQVRLDDADDQGRATVAVQVRPLASCIWAGAMLLVVGGAVTLGQTSRRRRQRTSPASRQARNTTASTGSPAVTRQ